MQLSLACQGGPHARQFLFLRLRRAPRLQVRRVQLELLQLGTRALFHELPLVLEVLVLGLIEGHLLRRHGHPQALGTRRGTGVGVGVVVVLFLRAAGGGVPRAIAHRTTTHSSERGRGRSRLRGRGPRRLRRIGHAVRSHFRWSGRGRGRDCLRPRRRVGHVRRNTVRSSGLGRVGRSLPARNRSRLALALAPRKAQALTLADSLPRHGMRGRDLGEHCRLGWTCRPSTYIATGQNSRTVSGNTKKKFEIKRKPIHELPVAHARTGLLPKLAAACVSPGVHVY